MKNLPNKIIVHHTGGTDKYPLMDTSHHTFDDVRAWHLSKGWDDIGYHWFIEEDGKVTAGRPETMHGAHCKGHNTKSVGVCLAGNFDTTMPTYAQTKALIKVLSGIMERWDIPYAEIYPHRKFANKSCCGNKLPDNWASMLMKPGLASPTTCNGLHDKVAEQDRKIKALVRLLRKLLGLNK